MRTRRWVGSGLAVILLVAFWQGVGPGVTPEKVASAATPGEATALTPVGAGSCSATACHGSVRPASKELFPSRVLRNEHTTWLSQDLHANAYSVLFSKRSQAIELKLSGKGLPAHKDVRCLACHATPNAEPLLDSSRVVREDGVGCESCHGPAERWLGAHTQLGWRELSDDQKLEYGMRPTKALGRRAAICVECHVGAPARDGLPARDMNHDMIAAGHPRLNFEFSAFLANMPPHWAEDTGGNFAARTWAIGQVATAKAALDLLHDRARKSAAQGDRPVASSAPWPEFSEYDCFACHHDLVDETWRKHRVDTGLPPGTLPWGTWYYPMIANLAKLDPHSNAAGLGAKLQGLRAEMGRPSPDQPKVLAESKALSDTLGRWLTALPEETKSYNAAKVKSLIDSLETAEARNAVTGWDQATQRYLALQPLRLSLKALEPASPDPLKGELDALYGRLQFPKGFDSPRRFAPESGR